MMVVQLIAMICLNLCSKNFGWAMPKWKSPHVSSINSCRSPFPRIQRIHSSTFADDKELRGEILKALFSKGNWKLVNEYVEVRTTIMM